MKRNRGIFWAAGLVLALFLCGCQQKVVTVADVQVQEGETPKYIEMQAFELKEEVEESGKEEVLHCAVLIPEGYYASEEIPGMYVHEMAPLDSSNVYYSMAEGIGGNVSETLTEQVYKEYIEKAFAQSGKKAALTVNNFESVDMDGVPAYKIRSTYEAEGHTILQLTYMILGETTHTVTYSQSADDELMADFEVAEGEIKLVRAKDKDAAK